MVPPRDVIHSVTISGVKTGRSFQDTNMLTAVILTFNHVIRHGPCLYFAREGGEPEYAGRKSSGD